jgi:DNA-binding NarL/FixJ family response regulator
MAAGPIKVLIADDDEDFLRSLRALIDSQPELSVVAAAPNGAEVLVLAEQAAPDAVVIDLHMPLLDGVTTVAHLRRDHPALCLIAVTGDSDPSLHRAATDAGADAVLEKRELAEALLERLANVRRDRRSPGTP